MASIAKLSVILSAVTQPLEQGLKQAQSKVSLFQSSFGSSIKHGVGAMMGAVGVDKVEQAMKKAIKSMPELNDAADKLEISFGKTLIHMTAMNQWLPTLAKETTKVAGLWEGGFAQQELKEKFMWLYEFSKRFDGERADRLAQLSRQEFIAAKLAEQNALRLADIKRKQFEVERERQWVQMAGTDEQKDYLKELESTYKRLSMEDPAYKAARVAGMLKDAPKSSSAGSIRHLTEEIAKLEEKKKAQEAITKLMEDGKHLIESVQTPFEKLTALQTEYNKMLNAGAIDVETYNRAIKALTPGLKELEAIQDEIFRLEKGQMALDLKKLQESGATKEVLEQYEKDFKRLSKLKEEWAEIEDGIGGTSVYNEKPATQFAEALSGERALGAIMKAQAGMRQPNKDTTQLMEKHIELEMKQVKLNEDLLKKQGDALEIWKRIKPSNVVRL